MGLRDNNIKLINSWGSDLVLVVEVLSSDLYSNLTLINIYGSCHERALFWNNIFLKSLLNSSQDFFGWGFQFLFRFFGVLGTFGLG